MKDLWDEARLYGLVNLYSNRDGKYWCQITFNTIKHVELTASSKYGVETPEAALIGAIEAAKSIVDSLEDATTKLKMIPR
jgi:hypothetical protein